MKARMPTKFALAALAIFLMESSADFALAQQEDYLALPDLTLELQNAIFAAKRISDQPPFFILEKVALTLRGEKRLGADGKLNFAIPVFRSGIDIAAKGSKVHGETLELVLVTPERVVVGGQRAVDFAAMIATLKSTFRSDVGLRPKSIKYMQRWALRLEAGGSISVVVAKVGADIAQENSQEIAFHLCETRNLSDCI